MKNKLYGAAGVCVLLACIFADGESPWPLLTAMAAAALFAWAAEKAPAVTVKRPAGPHKKRARARRRAKLATIIMALVVVMVESSWAIHEIELPRALPNVTGLTSMLNLQKDSPAELRYNIEEWPELERVFRSGMDATALVGELTAAGMDEASRARFTEDWPELTYLLEK